MMKKIMFIINVLFTIFFIIITGVGFSQVIGMYVDMQELSAVALFLYGGIGLIYELNYFNKYFNK